MRAMWRRVMTLVWKEFLELRQDPRLAAVVIVAPIIQLTMLGYAATTDVRDVPMVVVDGDRSASSRALFERFAGSRYFQVVDEFIDPREAGEALEAGTAWIAVIVPPGFGDSLLGSGPASSRTVQIRERFRTRIIPSAGRPAHASSTPASSTPM